MQQYVSSETVSKATLIHVADPMCSWCYAFEPELKQIVEETGLAVRLVMGGLYTLDRTMPLDESLRAYLRETWKRVSDISQQPVAFDLADWPEWTYDTEPACRAVIAVRRLAPARALAFFEELQHAFYADNLDVTRAEVLADLSAGFGIDRDAFLELLADGDSALVDFQEARALGATGFPLLVLDTGSEQIPVSVGFNRAEGILRTIRVLV